MIKKSTQPLAAKLIYLILLTILILIAFQGFLTTWIASATGGLLIWRAWKEFLLLIAFIAGLWLLLSDPLLRKYFFKQKIVWISAAYAAWLLFATIIEKPSFGAVSAGLIIQLRLLLAFLLAYIASYYMPVSRSHLKKILLLPAVVVIGFGLLQMFVLPYDFLSHFGYVKNVTIPPFFTIDEQLNRLRIASTLRGPNPLGVYLILPGMLLLSTAAEYVNRRSVRRFIYTVASFVALSVVLYGSHSRGAWIGFVAAATIYLYLSIARKFKPIFLVITLVVLSFGSLGAYHFRHTQFVENVIVHDDPDEGGLVSSNKGHLDSLKDGLKDVQHKPLLGCGAGCAGPASVHNTNGVKISENYFIQTAQESGLIGLGVLLASFILVGWILLKNSNDPLSRLFLASFIGINIASLLAHAWADDTIAYVWWISAALVINMIKPTTLKTKQTKPQQVL